MDDTAIIVTPCKHTLLISYLESYLNDFQRIAIIFARSGRHFIQPRPVTLRGANAMGQHNSLSGVTLDTRLTWSPHMDQVRKRIAQRMGVLGPLLNRKSDISVRNAP